MTTELMSESDRNMLLLTLAKLGGETYKEEDVIFEGNKVVLPAGSNIRQMIAFLEAKEREDEENTVFSKTYNYRPWDGAVATWNALKKLFGSVIHTGVVRQSMFGPMKEPPELVEVATSPYETTQVPWGRMIVPLLEGVSFFTGKDRHPEHGDVFLLSATGPKKWRNHVNGLFQLVEEELEHNSIYRGKAFDGSNNPRFLEIDAVDASKMIYSENTYQNLQANIFAGLRHPKELESLGVPSKRAVLLWGKFGTGKTSTAMIVAQEATASGWSFVYAVPGRDNLDEVMKTARLYQPCVVFFEDLDNLADPTGKQGTDHITRLLDMFDGFSAKGTRMLAILTTNYPDRITEGMLRPGRLDAVIELEAPDHQAIIGILKTQIREDLLNDVDWDAVAVACEGYLPAFVTEVAGRALRYALIRNPNIKKIRLETEDLVFAANGLRPQWERMQGAPTPTPGDSLTTGLKEVVEQSVYELLLNDVVGADGVTMYEFLPTQKALKERGDARNPS